jgi:hypothetical protein
VTRTMAAAAATVSLAAAAPAGAPLLHGFGFWSLARLGGRDVVLAPAAAPSASWQTRFALPPHSRQGNAGWYVVRLHFRLALPALRPGAHVQVRAETDGAPSAELDFRVRRRGFVELVRTDVGVITGTRVVRSLGRTQEVRFANYLQDAGVRPGTNTLTLSVSRNALARGVSVRFRPDTGLGRIHGSPARVSARVPAVVRLPLGRRTPLVVALRNSGGAAASVDVRLVVPGDAFRVAQPHAHVAGLRPHASARATFLLEPLRAGRFQLWVVGTTTSNHFVQQLQAVVG